VERARPHLEQRHRHVRAGALTGPDKRPDERPDGAPEPPIVFAPPLRHNAERGSRREETVTMRDIDALTAERDRIESELRQFEERQETLEKEGAGLLGQTKAAEDDEEALAKLKIELEQLAEAKRENDRSIEQSTKRLEEIETLIAMQEQSDMS
jgi:hypothetical protein